MDQRVTGQTPSYFTGANLPVERLSSHSVSLAYAVFRIPGNLVHIALADTFGASSVFTCGHASRLPLLIDRGSYSLKLQM